MSNPVRTAFIYLMHLAWKSRLHIPFLLTACFLVFDIRLQLEVNINMTRRRAQRMGIQGDGNDSRENHAPNSVNFNIDEDDYYDDDDDDDGEGDNDINSTVAGSNDTDDNETANYNENCGNSKCQDCSKERASAIEIPKLSHNRLSNFENAAEIILIKHIGFYKRYCIGTRNSNFSLKYDIQPLKDNSNLMVTFENDRKKHVH